MEQAIFYLRKSMELDELYFQARRNLITLLYKTQRKQEAIRQAQKLIALKPDGKLLKWAKTAIEKMSR
ncbi:MAG: hypothetical protein JKY59_10070 [Emcibacter sp.]|nr:hypothetical protein [Emcibacter sp.]